MSALELLSTTEAAGVARLVVWSRTGDAHRAHDSGNGIGDLGNRRSLDDDRARDSRCNLSCAEE
jgi:hypothetical protein